MMTIDVEKPNSCQSRDFQKSVILMYFSSAYIGLSLQGFLCFQDCWRAAFKNVFKLKLNGSFNQEQKEIDKYYVTSIKKIIIIHELAV